MYLFAGSWVLFLFGIIAIIFSINGYPVLYTVYSGLMALLFSMFLVYDTQQVLNMYIPRAYLYYKYQREFKPRLFTIYNAIGYI